MNIDAALIDIDVISGLAARIKVSVASNYKVTDPVKDAEKIIQICKRLAETVSGIALEPKISPDDYTTV